MAPKIEIAITSAAINAALASATLSVVNLTAASTGWIGWSSRTVLRSSADGVLSIRNFAETQQADLSLDAIDVLALRRGTNTQTLRIYNTYTDASNYERFGIRYTGGAWTLGHENAGTGSSRLMRFGAGSYIEVDDGPGTVSATRGAGSSSNTIFQVTATGLTSTVLLFTRLTPSINQASGTYTVLDINPTETAVGAGPHYLIRGRIGAGSDVFGVKNDGAIMSGNTSSGVQFKNNGGTEAAFTRGDGTTAIAVKAGTFRSTGGVLSSFGTASGAGAGSIAYVTDLTSTTRGSTATGGGALKAFIWSDGTNWIVM